MLKHDCILPCKERSADQSYEKSKSKAVGLDLAPSRWRLLDLRIVQKQLRSAALFPWSVERQSVKRGEAFELGTLNAPRSDAPDTGLKS